jgi:pyrophosphatase PpaX
MTPRFQAALFDVDGTLVDSREFVLGAMEHALRAHRLPVPPRVALAATIGPPLEECYRKFVPHADIRVLCEAHRAWQRQQLHLVVPFPNTRRTLETLKAAGVRLAAVTSRSRVSSLGSLDMAGLASFLEVTISAEDAPRTKPYPDPLLLALERLHVKASAAVMIGDTVADIEAGKAAGTRTIAALYGFAGPSLQAVPADHFIRDIAEVTAIILPM